LLSARYGATVAHLRRIFFIFLHLQGRECVGEFPLTLYRIEVLFV